jgi:trypsin-like peptidase
MFRHAKTSAPADPLDREIKLLDIDLKREELKKAKRRFRLAESSPIIVGILAALIGFLGNVIATYFQGENALEIEHQKQQGSLITEAIKTGNPDSAAKNLIFLLEAGLIDDPTGKLRQRISRKEQVPVLPARDAPLPSFGIGQPVQNLSTNDQRRKLAAAVGEIVTDQGGCTGFLVSANQLLTASYCADEGTNLAPKLVKFGYTSKTSKVVEYKVRSVLEKGGGISYAILGLDGEPGRAFGTIPVSTRPAVVGEPVFILHHSLLGPMSISTGHLTKVSAEDIEYDCQTAPGASGSPVLASRDLALLGVHVGTVTRGGNLVPNRKHAFPISIVLDRSAALRVSAP